MKPAALALTVLVLALTTVAPARAADVQAARAFLERLYAHYRPATGAWAFDPTGTNAADVFDPSMIAFFRENARLTPKGDEGAIEGDPICDCQDSGGMRSRILAFWLVAPDTAMADVDLIFSAASPPEVRRLTITLVTIHGQWRIYDISSKDMPSFRAYLIKANREARAGH
jgi:hypothetical protein